MSAGRYRSSAGISPLCPPHPCCCALLRGSEVSPPATHSLCPRRGFLVCGNLSSFTAPSHWCRSHPYSFFFFLNLFIYFFSLLFFLWLCWVFISVRGLSLVVASGGHSSSWCAGLSLSRPLLLQSTGSRRAGSVILAHGPSCSAACGILPDQGLNPCPPHQQADPQPLYHQGSPPIPILLSLFFLLPYPGTWGVSCLWESLRSSASVQAVFRRSCSTCRCISDVFVGRKMISTSYSFTIFKQAGLLLLYLLPAFYSQYRSQSDSFKI